MTSKKLLPILAVLAIFVSGASFLFVSSKKTPVKTEHITVAWSPFENATLLWVAMDNGFFGRNGLDVALRRYDSGAKSLDGMLNGEADIVVGVTEFPIVRKAFQGLESVIIGIIAKVENLYLVGRKDRGIEKVSDLKGKKIGTTFGTIAEFYLGRFLLLNALSMRDIAVVNLKTPSEWENAVADGTVDAILTAQPHADAAGKRLGENAVFWPVQRGQHIFGLIATSHKWVAEHPEMAVRFLRAIEQAEEYAVHNPVKAKAIMQNRLNVDATFAESAWERDQFTLELDQSLIVALEDEARWMVKSNVTGKIEIPDFRNYVRGDFLESAKPEAVNLVR